MTTNIQNLKTTVLSDKTFSLKEYTFDYQHTKDDAIEEHLREVYDHGDGASVLLYNRDKKTVVLTQQFRLPTFLNGSSSGMSIEVCAGSLDGDTPEECAKKEAEEETGFIIDKLEKAFEVYASPAVMTEIAHLFIAEYNDDQKVNNGGGLSEEQEYIDVLEIEFEKAFNMIALGEIKDARTVMLLQYLKIKDIMKS
ncbi:NUDIX domain-containing protein [Aquimarina litoralis]|uniref:NUDIX domain-containing protein n=1 Tax=Aquimarina litoralis TaxID=584605 RepID=UPI001C56E86B|nr:NUDIX domain-containing protein [Aquimarina litoralis]MBW1297264.1 NUDIX domain-containing protein [Aquimarina litoralis]